MNTAAVILAAGKGTRMKSDLPKVLHEVAGLPMLGHVLNAAAQVDASKTIVVLGHGAEKTIAATTKLNPEAVTVLQTEQLGTAHAVLMAKEELKGFEGDTYILYGDTPLITADTLRKMHDTRVNGADIVVLGFEAEVPGGYGRLILSADGGLEKIVEAKEAKPEELAVKLCNSGVILAPGPLLLSLLDRVDNNNAKGEYYLTDIIGLARNDNKKCAVVECSESEVLGVNARTELAEAEAAFQVRTRKKMMEEGVTLISPETVTFSHDTKIAPDVIVEPNVVFAAGARIEKNARIRAYSYLEECHVDEGAIIGPYARLRPGTKIGKSARIGNFVEVKNARFADGAKANHLTYIGDAEVGAAANIGAGTITCNYDGFLKHKTKIGDGAFIGSNSSLIAPITIGDGAYVGSGSVVSADIPDDALAIARARQVNKAGLAAKLRSKLQALKNKK